MKKKFIDKWWVRIIALAVIPSLLSGGSGVLGCIDSDIGTNIKNPKILKRQCGHDLIRVD